MAAAMLFDYKRVGRGIFTHNKKSAAYSPRIRKNPYTRLGKGPGEQKKSSCMRNSFPGEVYINGTWRPHEQAAISVFDRGFLFGDGIYEVISVYDNQLFALTGHLQRMQGGLDEIGIVFDADTLADVARQAVARAVLPAGEGCVYLQVTRGVAPRAHRFPATATPTVIAYAYPFSLKGFQDKLATVIVSPDERWHKCHIKSTSLVANVIANQAAHGVGADENVMARDGLITEGSHTNVFFIRNGVVYTHPLGPYILPGITRALVLELCKTEGIPVQEDAVCLAELNTVDEAFLTGTTTQILGIGRMMRDDETLFSVSSSGPVTQRLQEAFVRRVRALIG